MAAGGRKKKVVVAKGKEKVSEKASEEPKEKGKSLVSPYLTGPCPSGSRTIANS